MSQQGLREVEHEITISAPAAAVYRLIAEVENWPRIFPPTIYVDHLERSGDLDLEAAAAVVGEGREPRGVGHRERGTFRRVDGVDRDAGARDCSISP
jgi:uncharacterized protein YndB with AHSA1/START domain